MKWTVIAGFLLGCGVSSTRAQGLSFEDARKGGEAGRIACLEQEIGRLVPKGCLKAWYYMANAEQKAKAEAALREEYARDKRQSSFEKEMAAMLKALESPGSRIVPFFREEAPIGQKKGQGILLVGDVFGLRDEAEFRSTLEDYIVPFLKSREEGMEFKEGDNEYVLNAYAPANRDIAHTSLVNLYARSVQLQKIAGKDRNASDGFRRAAVKDYLDSHKLYLEQLKKQQKIWDDNNENEMQKEIVSFLNFMRDFIHKNLKKAGVEHKVIDKKTSEYSLEGI